MVCERVGNNLVMTAVLKPSATNPNAARNPAPPKNQNQTLKCNFLFYLCEICKKKTV